MDEDGEGFCCSAWGCGFLRRGCATPIDALGNWSVFLFYPTVGVVTIAHLMVLDGGDDRGGGATAATATERTTLVSRVRRRMGWATTSLGDNGADGGFSRSRAISFAVWLFVLAVGRWLGAIDPRYVQISPSADGSHRWPASALQLLGSAILAICTCVFLRVHLDMGNSWYPRPNVPPRLVTHGVFRYARHPMYAAFVWAPLGALLATLNWPLAWFFSGGALVAFRRIRKEDRILMELFGESYVEYRRDVSALGWPWQCLGFD